MKTVLKKNTLAVLIASSLSTFSYAQTTVDVDGSFTVPGETVTSDSINNKIMALKTDANLSQNTLDINTVMIGNQYYPTDQNNNVIEVNGLNNSNAFIYGGYCLTMETCEVGNTHVVMTNGAVNDIYGAYAHSSPPGAISPYYATATGSVYLTEGTVRGNIYGAYSISSYDFPSSAIGNVYVTGGTVSNIAGAYAISSIAYNFSNSSSSATGNVYLTGGTVRGMIIGAYAISSNSAASTTGSVYLADGAVGGNIYGAYTASSYSATSATGRVYLANGTVGGNIHGAYSLANAPSSPSSATGSVYLTGGTVSGDIYGAKAESGFYSFRATSFSDDYSSAIANGDVYIHGNVKLQNDGSGSTQYNSNIWGGFLGGDPYYYNVFNDNLLSIGNEPLIVKSVGNFANYHFYLNDFNKEAIANDIALLTVTNSIKNNNTVADDGMGGRITTQNKSTIRVAGISGEGIVSKGSVVTLIDASGDAVSFIQGDESSATVSDISALFDTQNGDKSTGVKVGLIREADIHYGIAGNKITATIDNIRESREIANINVKPLAEGRLTGMQNAVRGADMLLDVMGNNEAIGSFTPIAVINGGVNKYKSGSHVDSRDYRLMVGSRYQVLDNLYTGLTLEYGRSNYDTYNEGDVHGKGHTYNYGASLFTKFSSLIANGNKMYMDGAVRFGRTSTEFNSNDIITGSGSAAHYNSKVNYFGTHVGTGFIYTLDELNSFDSSIRYLWTRLGSDSVVLDGDKINFDKSNSSRVQLKEQYNRQATENLTFSLAGIYEYEFDGDAKTNVSGIAIDAPSVKGSTGIMELGIKGTPIADNKDLAFNLSFKGYGGKRQGASASAFVQYNF